MLIVELGDMTEENEATSHIEARKRPTGLTVIAMLWFIGSSYGIITSVGAFFNFYMIWPLLSEPSVLEWYKFGVPAEFAITLVLFVLTCFSICVVYGFLTGKSWSYKLALALPILGVIGWSLRTGLYMWAPIELEFSNVDWTSLGAGLVWLIVIWAYVRRPHVKEYLRTSS